MKEKVDIHEYGKRLEHALGSVRLVSSATVTTLFSSNYRPYGTSWSVTGTMVSPFAYTGKPKDSVTGLYYFGARFLDPTIGRFITEDSNKGTKSDPLSQNRYIYAEDNPMKFVDPTGHRIAMSSGLGTVTVVPVVTAVTPVSNLAAAIADAIQEMATQQAANTAAVQRYNERQQAQSGPISSQSDIPTGELDPSFGPISSWSDVPVIGVTYPSLTPTSSEAQNEISPSNMAQQTYEGLVVMSLAMGIATWPYGLPLDMAMAEGLSDALAYLALAGSSATVDGVLHWYSEGMLHYNTGEQINQPPPGAL